MLTELFEQALHISSPWFIKSIDFNADKKRLDIHVDFKRGSTFADPDSSGEQARHATSRNSGTPVTLIRSPTQRMGYALNALRP